MAFRGSERRGRTRFRVRISFALKNNGQEVRGVTRNISLLGISAYTDGPLPQVQPVQCALELPEEPRPVLVNGTVIRCVPLPTPHSDGPFEMGVFFKEFRDLGEVILSKFLDRVAREEQRAIRAGYRILKQRINARRRRRRTEELRRRRRRLMRLRRRKKRLQAERRKILKHHRKRSAKK